MKKFFNMIEVTLAIAVVGLGMAGIMSLFPVGFQASRDAIGDNYANNASQLFTSYLKLSARQSAEQLATWNTLYWNDTFNNISVIPTSKPDSAGAIETTNPDVSSYTDLGSGIYQKLNTATPPTPVTPGLYRVYQGNTNLKDFTAAVRVWKTPVTSPVCTTGTWAPGTLTYSEACGINIEFTWPVEKPYASRSRRIFYIEFFKSL